MELPGSLKDRIYALDSLGGIEKDALAILMRRADELTAKINKLNKSKPLEAEVLVDELERLIEQAEKVAAKKASTDEMETIVATDQAELDIESKKIIAETEEILAAESESLQGEGRPRTIDLDDLNTVLIKNTRTGASRLVNGPCRYVLSAEEVILEYFD